MQPCGSATQQIIQPGLLTGPISAQMMPHHGHGPSHFQLVTGTTSSTALQRIILQIQKQHLELQTEPVFMIQ